MQIAWCEVNVNLLPQCQACWGFFNEPDHLFKGKNKNNKKMTFIVVPKARHDRFPSIGQVD